MAVVIRTLYGNAVAAHIIFEHRAQLGRRFALAADADREVSAAWEHPDVTFEAGQELDVDVIAMAGHEIAERGHAGFTIELRAQIAEGIPRARGGDAIVCGHAAGARSQRPLRTGALDGDDARLFESGSCAFGAIEQHAIQIVPGINQQRAIERECDGTAVGSGKHRIVHDLLRSIVFDEEGIFGISLEGDAAAAWLFPREFFIEDNGLHARRREFFGSEGSGRASAENRDFHRDSPEGI